MGETTCVVHLVWAPLGPGPVRRFADSYVRHDAGADHRLLVVFNGFRDSDDERIRACEDSLASCRYERLLLERSVRDLNAYRRVAEHEQARRFCFLNSYSRVLGDGWLRLLEEALAPEEVGMVGATGSYESSFSAAPFWLRPRQRQYPPFPNRHLRTNGFMLDRELLLDLDWPPATSKRAAWGLESGWGSLSRQVWERGLEVLVVGRDGRRFAFDQWPVSDTFRTGGQGNLLIADNQTDEYAQADAAARARMQRRAWGAHASVAQ